MATYVFWWLLGLIAMIIEFLTGTFYLLVLALAFAVGGLLAYAGFDTSTQALFASASGLVALLVVRRIKKRLSPPPDSMGDPDIGQSVTLLNEHQGIWRVSYRGSQWDARITDGSIPDSDHATITGREGNCLIISTQPTGHH